MGLHLSRNEGGSTCRSSSEQDVGGSQLIDGVSLSFQNPATHRQLITAAKIRRKAKVLEADRLPYQERANRRSLLTSNPCNELLNSEGGMQSKSLE